MFEKLFNKDLVKELESVKITYKAKKAYKDCVKNNSKESDELLEKKLKRNWILAKDTETVSCYGTKTRHYGNLAIHMRDDKIISIYNDREIFDVKFDIDNKLKKKLNKILGL